MSSSPSILKINDVKEFLWVALRTQDRFASHLKTFVDAFDRIREGEDEWLISLQDEVGKGISFCETQLSSWQGFGGRVDEYIASVRKEADDLAIQELKFDKKGMEVDSDVSGSTKALHPELIKFKLEKQARILGKYGGVPAMGAGMVMPMLPRDRILKATASPAAREIQYSKVEGRDAQNLAEVMQFHARRRPGGSDSGGGVGGTTLMAAAGGGGGKVLRGDELATEASPWQAETLERKGKEYFRARQQSEEEAAAAAALSRTPVSNELGGILKERQELLARAEAEAAAAARRPPGADPATPKIGSDATSELAEKLSRQQVNLKASEALQAAELLGTPEFQGTSSSSRWSNASAPFGSELSAVLQQRSIAKSSQQALTAAGPSPSPGFAFRAASNDVGDSGGVFTPPPLKRTPLSAPSHTLATGAAAAGASTSSPAINSELAEALRARQERQRAASSAMAPI